MKDLYFSSSIKIMRGTMLLVSVYWTILVVYFTNFILRVSLINQDAGTYLPIVERILDGYVPYKDIAIGYTPLALYILAFFNLLVGGEAGYSLYISICALFQVASSYLIFKISYYISRDILIRYFFSVLAILSLYSWQGIYIVLEPYVVFFSLLSVHFYLKSDDKSLLYYVLSGVCVSLSFLSKQYGVAVGMAIGLVILFEKEIFILKVKHILLFVFGCAIPLSIFVFYYSFVSNVQPVDLFAGISGGTYASTHGISYKKVFSSLLFYSKMNAHILFLLPLAVFADVASDRKYVVLNLFIFLLFSLSLSVRQFGHYFMLLVPSTILIELFILNSFYEKYIKERSVIYFLLCCFSLFLVVYGSTNASSYLFEKEVKQSKYGRHEQYAIGKEINSIVPEQSRVALFADPSFWYICKFYPPQFSKYGYGFVTNYNSTQIDELLSSSQYAIITRDLLQVLEKMNDVNVVSLLSKNKYIELGLVSEKYTIWKKI